MKRKERRRKIRREKAKNGKIWKRWDFSIQRVEKQQKADSERDEAKDICRSEPLKEGFMDSPVQQRIAECLNKLISFQAH